jgi:membrane protease YdiL (CAAX protease family)
MKWTWAAIWDNERGGWWRLAVTLAVVLLFLALEFFTGLAGIIHLPPLLIGALARALALAGLLAAVRFVHRRPIRCVFTDGRPFGIRLAIQSALLWALLWFSVELVQSHGWQELTQRAGEIASGWRTELARSLLSRMMVSSVLEEVLFRGYLLPRLGAWLKRPWLAIGLTAMLFTAAHFNQGRSTCIAMAFWGVLFGVACIRAGTLAPLLAFHATNNWLVMLRSPNHKNANTTWLGLSVFIVMLFIWFGWLLWATRRKRVRTMAQPGGAANRSQPVGSETDRTSAAAGSGS